MKETITGENLNEKVLPDYIKMYEISGQEAITSDSLDRYMKDKNQDSAIDELLKHPPRFISRDFYEATTENQKVIIIKRGLESDNLETQSIAVNLIRELPEQKKAEAVMIGAKCNKPIIQQMLSSYLYLLPIEHGRSVLINNLKSQNQEVVRSYINTFLNDRRIKIEEIGTFIKQGLESNDKNLQKACAAMLGDYRLLSLMKESDEKDRLINVCLESHDPEIFMKVISCVPEEKRPDLIKMGLESNNLECQQEAVDSILYAPKNSQYDLIKCIIDTNNPKIVEKMANNFDLYVSKDEAKEIIEIGLKNSNPIIQKIFASRLERTNIFGKKDGDSTERGRFEEMVIENIKKGLESNEIETQKAAAATIRYAPKEKIPELISLALGVDNFEVKKFAVESIYAAPEKDKISLIKKCLDVNDSEIQKLTLRNLQGIKNIVEKKKMFDYVVEKKLGNELVASPLYDKNIMSSDKFSREDFKKTGSKTTLIGGELKTKTIVRTIEPEYFDSWQRLYENYKIWQGYGFDYVPIEPIQSYKVTKDGMINVYSSVLDINLRDWNRLDIDIYSDQLVNSKTKIQSVLDDLQIKHGHPHDANFCLRFFRDKDNQIDFKQTPRIYLIDFDQAVSSGKITDTM